MNAIEDKEHEQQLWVDRGACKTENVDLRIFFPTRGESSAPAELVCSRCPVVNECFDYAMRNNIMHGVWGGKSERQRRIQRSAKWKARQLALSTPG